MATWSILGQVLFGMLLGGVVGVERELKGKPAGLRTHMLVCGAATLLVLLAGPLIGATDVATESPINTDPVRVIEAIIVGISFIGAGTIWKSGERERVRHISTAASILFTAAIGIAVAVGEHAVAAVLAALVAVVLHLFDKAEERWLKPGIGGNR